MNNSIKYESMDDDDIRFYLKDARILKYTDLANVKDIEKLLPRHKSYIILLYPVESEESGHWCALTRFDKMIEYFDAIF